MEGERLGEEGNSSLECEDGEGGQQDCPAECAAESEGREAVHNGLNGEHFPGSLDAFEDGAVDAERVQGEHDATGEESLARGARFSGGLGWGEDVAGESAEVVEADLDTEEATGSVAEGEGDNGESELPKDLHEGAVEAGPAEFEAGPENEDAEEELDGTLGIGGRFLAGEDTE